MTAPGKMLQIRDNFGIGTESLREKHRRAFATEAKEVESDEIIPLVNTYSRIVDPWRDTCMI